nr:6-bladed beta-propeller [uncultured Bacteroides sp.]
MQKLNTFLILWFCLLAFSSCQDEQRDDNQSILIADLDNVQVCKKENLSSFFKRVGVIVLETTEQSLLGRIDKIDFINDYLYVLERRRGLFLFNKNGKFIKMIGDKGVGPGEYISPSDITVDYENKKIYLLDSQTQMILKYDIEGNYEQSFKLKNKKKVCKRIQYFDNRIYTDLYSFDKSDDVYLLCEMNAKNGKDRVYSLDASKYNKGWNELFNTEQQTFISQINKNPKFMQLFMDTIFEITKEGLQPKIAIQSEYLVTDGFVKERKGKKNASEFYNELNSANKVYNVHNYIESDKYVCFKYFINNTAKTYIYNKVDSLGYIVECLADDLLYIDDIGMRPMTKFISYDEKYAYSIEMNSNFTRTLFLENIENNKISSQVVGGDKLRMLKGEDNPIIVYYEFKH